MTCTASALTRRSDSASLQVNELPGGCGDTLNGHVSQVVFVRKVTTASGATAVQVARNENRRDVVSEYLGSAHTDAAIAALVQAARAKIEERARRTQPRPRPRLGTQARTGDRGGLSRPGFGGDSKLTRRRSSALRRAARSCDRPLPRRVVDQDPPACRRPRQAASHRAHPPVRPATP